MKQICIITFYYGCTNYGACLQSYALVKYLENIGYNAKQICYDESSNAKSGFTNIFTKMQVAGLQYTVKKIVPTVLKFVISKYQEIMGIFFQAQKKITMRENAFISFRDGIEHTQEVYTNENIAECTGFDVYICGSDQIWHGINKVYDLNKCYWLKFVKYPAKKISYAASIALNRIPLEAYGKVQEALSDFDAISVREQEAKNELDRILGKEGSVSCVLDPTFLLTRDEWDANTEENPYKKKEYIFAYILGNRKQDRKCVIEFAKKNNLNIIAIPYLLNKYRGCDRKFGDIQISNVSPKLWITLIRDAKYIFTDSFHAAVFSILFQKEFFIFKRFKDNDVLSMNSRIHTLVFTFKLEQRIISSSSTPEEISRIQKINYQIVENILEKKRVESERFLRDAIEGENESKPAQNRIHSFICTDRN